MKWKDAEDSVPSDEVVEEEYFDEEEYSPWGNHKKPGLAAKLIKPPVLIGLAVVAIVALVVAALMLMAPVGDQPTNIDGLAALEQRVAQLEERLDKFEAIDEKVTQIWEQAKSYEKFKARFERAEASTSLRMDHLTMSLENLQKKFNENGEKSGSAKRSAKSVVKAKPAAAPTPSVATKPTGALQYHQVAKGETLYSIARRYNLAVDELLKMNKLKPGSVIQPGQKLIVKRKADQ